MSEEDMIHTPGPWHVAPGRIENRHMRLIGSNFLENGGIWIAEAKGPDCIPNARLIAAAPELLEALSLCVIKLSRYRQQHPETYVGGVLAEYEAALKIAREAIAKATSQ